MLVASPQELLHGFVQQVVAVLELRDLKFGAAQVDGSGDDVEGLEIGARALHFSDGHTSFEDVVYGRFAGFVTDAKGRRTVSLRIHVDNQYPSTVLSEGRGDIDRGSSLADPSLLVGHGDEARTGGLGECHFLQPGIAIEFMRDFRTYCRIACREDTLDGIFGGFNRHILICHEKLTP